MIHSVSRKIGGALLRNTAEYEEYLTNPLEDRYPDDDPRTPEEREAHRKGVSEYLRERGKKTNE
jgi:hypothetical protein